jgi:integrase
MTGGWMELLSGLEGIGNQVSRCQLAVAIASLRLSVGIDGSSATWRLHPLRTLRWHDLRHTFASRLVMSGVDLYTVCRLLGHQDTKMTMRYAHLAPGYMKAAVNILTKRRKRTGTRTGTE